MFPSSWFTRKPARRHNGRARLGCERLEDRSVPATYTAATVPELIAAINLANDPNLSPGADTIELAGDTTFTLAKVNNTTDGNNGLPVIAGRRSPEHRRQRRHH